MNLTEFKLNAFKRTQFRDNTTCHTFQDVVIGTRDFTILDHQDIVAGAFSQIAIGPT